MYVVMCIEIMPFNPTSSGGGGVHPYRVVLVLSDESHPLTESYTYIEIKTLGILAFPSQWLF